MKTLKLDLVPQILRRQMELGREITNREIAEATGLSETRISLYKRGEVSMIKLDNLQALAEYLNCEAGDLLAAKPVLGEND